MRIHWTRPRIGSSTGRDNFYLMGGFLEGREYGEIIDLLPIGALKSKLPITSSCGSNSTSRSLIVMMSYQRPS